MIYTRVCKDKRTFEEFYAFADKCWSKERGFMLITCDPTKGTKYTDGEEVINKINTIANKLTGI